MRRIHIAGLCAVAILVLVSAQVGSAKTQGNSVKTVAHPVWTLAMDGARVAYASGAGGNSESIHVWNVGTGSTSVIHGGRHGFAVHHTSAIAISRKRVVWVRSVQFGNTELDHWLYTASIGGSPRLLKRVLGDPGDVCTVGEGGGPQVGGLAGSRGAVVASTWKAASDGSVPTNERLALVTPTGLQTIATGASAVRSESVDGGHIAVLPFPTLTVTPDGCASTLPTSVVVYSTAGALLKTVALPAVDPSTLGYQVAIRGNRLVVLTYGLHQPSGPAWVTLTVYDWTTGAQLHTWPVAIPQYPGEVSFSFYGNLAAVEGPYRLHLVDLDTGKDIKIAQASGTGCPPALGPRGLVYAINQHNTGSLVFVRTSRLLRLLG